MTRHDWHPPLKTGSRARYDIHSRCQKAPGSNPFPPLRREVIGFAHHRGQGSRLELCARNERAATRTCPRICNSRHHPEAQMKMGERMAHLCAGIPPVCLKRRCRVRGRFRPVGAGPAQHPAQKPCLRSGFQQPGPIHPPHHLDNACAGRLGLLGAFARQCLCHPFKTPLAGVTPRAQPTGRVSRRT